MTSIAMTINGESRRAEVEDRLLLVDALREVFGLTGTKVGCSQGVCGSCTVRLDGRAVRSCLSLAVQADGAEVRTVEGLADGDRLHPLQEAFRQEHGLQCGFCTPGLLMTAVDLVESGAPLDEEAARRVVAGNVCRCTGYDGIVRAVVSAARSLAGATGSEGGEEQ